MAQQGQPITASLNWVTVHFTKSDWKDATGFFMVLGITGNAAKHPTMPRVAPPSPLHLTNILFVLKC